MSNRTPAKIANRAHRGILNGTAIFAALAFISLQLFSPPDMPTFADSIVLKNGNVIEADFVWEEGGSIHYIRRGGEYAISKAGVSRVDRVQTSRRGTSVAPLPPSDIPATTLPTGEASTQPATMNRKSVDDWVLSVLPDPPSTPDLRRDLESRFADLSSQLDRSPNDAVIRDAWLNATATLVGQQLSGNDLTGATATLKRALAVSPDEFSLLLHWGAVALRLSDFQSAQEALNSAVKLSPNSPEAQELLGLSDYFLGRNSSAIAHWDRALKISPSAPVKGLLEKAKREQDVEGDFRSRASAHFSLSSDSKTMESHLVSPVLGALEKDYVELSAVFGLEIPQPIPVLLYAEQEFRQATQAPDVINGLNDGKMRIPVKGVSAFTPELAVLLKHELSHTFIQQKSHGRAPHWLHEGMAQFLSRPGICDRRNPWWESLGHVDSVTFSALEQGLESTGADAEVTQAYREALSVVCYLNDVFGSSAVQQLLTESAAQGSLDLAARSILHDSLDRVEIDWHNYVARQSRL
jgi:tetratricopeptide (TPR) repeat protein